eukprot:1153871-Pelagomonas_calceolata.AAC.4
MEIRRAGGLEESRDMDEGMHGSDSEREAARAQEQMRLLRLLEAARPALQKGLLASLAWSAKSYWVGVIGLSHLAMGLELELGAWEAGSCQQWPPRPPARAPPSLSQENPTQKLLSDQPGFIRPKHPERGSQQSKKNNEASSR